VRSDPVTVAWRSKRPSSANDADSPLRDVRLTGTIIAPDLRIAIFAVTSASPLVLSEGEALKDWRLDSISPGRVVLSGPAGNIVLKTMPDADLVRSPPPAAIHSGQLELGVPPSAASWQPLGGFYAASAMVRVPESSSASRASVRLTQASSTSHPIKGASLEVKQSSASIRKSTAPAV
jgi:hypothetical protein